MCERSAMDTETEEWARRAVQRLLELVRLLNAIEYAELARLRARR